MQPATADNHCRSGALCSMRFRLRAKNEASIGWSDMRKVWIGTSGWTYDGWRGPFYPENIAKKDWLAWYATRFPTTEINGSFYRTPSLAAVRNWRDQTSARFPVSSTGRRRSSRGRSVRAAARERRLALSFRSPRGAGALGGDGASRLCARARAAGALGPYSANTLRAWARHIAKWRRQRRTVSSCQHALLLSRTKWIPSIQERARDGGTLNGPYCCTQGAHSFRVAPTSRI